MCIRDRHVHHVHNVHRICTKLCQYIVLTIDNYHTNFQPQRSFRYQIAKFARVHIRAQITCTKVHRICTKLCQQIVLTENNNHTNFQPQRSFRYQITKIKRISLMTSSVVMTSFSEILNILGTPTEMVSTRPGVDQSSILKIVARKSLTSWVTRLCIYAVSYTHLTLPTIYSV